jgi:hypothetical protein
MGIPRDAVIGSSRRSASPTTEAASILWRDGFCCRAKSSMLVRMLFRLRIPLEIPRERRDASPSPSSLSSIVA